MKSSRLIKQAQESLEERTSRGNALMKKEKQYMEFGDVSYIVFILEIVKTTESTIAIVNNSTNLITPYCQSLRN